MISVESPTLNEAEGLGPLLDTLAARPEAKEAIVVDGRSTDGTSEIACGRGALLLSCEPGRGQQLRRGTEMARGEALLFHFGMSPAQLARLYDRAAPLPGTRIR